MLNAAPAQALPADLLQAVDILVVNEGELATVAQHDGSIAACLERIQVPTVVVTLGHRGCCARVHGAWVLQSAYPVTPVDTTAAGDTFCGTLVAALSQGTDMAQALRNASAAGALACTRLGAQSSIPAAAEVTALVARHGGSADVNTAPAHTALRAYCGLCV